MNNEREVTGGSEAVMNSVKSGFTDIFFHFGFAARSLEDNMGVSD